MRLRWTNRARRDLVEIGRYIARDDPQAARRCVDPLRSRARAAARRPRSGRVVPEFECDDIREVILGSYRIVYRLHRTAVDVLTVFEGHRLLGAHDIDNES
jgi:plasmid stabilization system protein ParE